MDGRILKRVLLVITVTGLCAGLTAKFSSLPELAQWAWGLGAAPVLASLAISILRDLSAGRMGVDAIAFLSMAGALALGESLAGVIIAIMYAGGNLLEDFAVGRAERDLKALIDRAPRLAHRKNGDAIEDAPIEAIAVGDAILVRAGEIVPIDGLITSPGALLDEAALTGEPIPVTRFTGEAASSGTINAGEAFEMRASATAGESTYAGIVRMVSAAQAAKAPFMRMADRYALMLLPITLALAAAAWWFSQDPIRALAVLVAATPCPLILAAPAAFIGGTSLAARRGILIKGGGPLEILARVHTVLFDKTGTLTVGGARLVSIETAPGVSPDEALRLAASLEQASHHVLAATIVSTARGKDLALSAPEDVREVLGTGLTGLVEGRRIAVGALSLVRSDERMEEWARRAAQRASWRSALTVFVAADGKMIAVLLFADELRRETPRAIRGLRSVGVERIVMVTGDRAEPAETIGAALDLDAVLSERVPSDKVDAVVAERRMALTLMVGDGINDAPALAAANVGMAMGARGASASSEAADAVLLVDRLDRVAEAVAIGKRTRAIALQSIVAGMTMSGLTMVAAAFGYVTPVAGALIQEAIDVAVILNALRALSPIRAFDAPTMSESAANVLREEHERLEKSLARLQEIVDALDICKAQAATALISEADEIVATQIVKHEREDEETVYPRVSGFLKDTHGLSAMSRAHREILHQARLLARLTQGLRLQDLETYLIRDAQHIVESIVSLVHIHNAQEEDIYEHAAAQFASAPGLPRAGAKLGGTRAPSAFERALAAPRVKRRSAVMAGALIALAVIAGGGAFWGWRHGRLPLQSREESSSAVVATIHARETTPITAETSGVIGAVYCKRGEAVRAGQPCARIEARGLQDELARQELALRQRIAEAERARAEAGQAKAAADRMARGGARKQKALSAARRAYERAQARALSEDAAMTTAEAAINATKATLKTAELVSPIDGTIVGRAVDVGKMVRAGEPSFLVASDIGVVKIEAQVDAAFAATHRLGDAIAFRVDDIPGQLFHGKLTQMSQEPAAGGADEMSVVLRASNEDGLLQPGSSIRIRFEQSGTGL
ncbi:hypothetical protein DSM21852_33240 [Methylocystis bryophila]|uniref:P-type Zn(2+) transporter n=1 Tax=Methylocystis bryophila TaxID=655015 RepID=A0A1W6MRM5_9HYPH|nr:hypothetical protein B1812_02475 [Methylocystis bryophila]BDV40071.1 hypothetical protein DSM21852_33240 [Methylocystis bryophila]